MDKRQNNKQLYTSNKTSVVNMIQQDKYTDEEWLGSQEGKIRNMELVTIKSFRMSSARSIIITKLESGGKIC